MNEHAVIEALSRKPFAVIGHRGAAGEAPENTIAAIRRALEVGADIVEVDVQRTRDGVLILLHDDDLRRVAGLNINVRTVSFSEIEHVTISGEPIATLDDALEVACGRLPLFIEIKHVEDTIPVLDRISRSGCVDWVAIISFHDEAIRIAKNRGFLAGLIYARPPGRIVDAKRIGASIVLPHFRLATQKAVSFAHRMGLKVVAWTVNDVKVARALADRGVDGIATDYPSMLVKLRDEISQSGDEHDSL